MIGLATIGQSPRDDIVPSMFGPGECSDILQAGALDRLDAGAIERLAPWAGEHPLVTRLNGAEEVIIAKERVTPLLQQAVDRLEAAGALLVCVLCTGEFNLGSTRSRVVYPDRVLLGVIDALLPAGTLGVVMPHAGQAASMRAKWARAERTVELAVHSPYVAGASMTSPARQLVDAGAQLIVLDCMGYTRLMQSEAQACAAAPVILANRTVGAVIESIGSRQRP